MDTRNPNEPPVTPPTFAGPVPTEPPRSKWPTVLGIIAIIMAGLGLLSVLGQFVSRLMPQPPAAATQPVYPQPPPAVAAIMAAGWLVVTVLLLVGGIALLNRRRWSARALVAWAIGDLVLTLAALAGTLLNLPALQQQMREQNAGMPPGTGGVMEAVIIGGMCIGTAIGLTPPIFALVWFHRRRIKEQMAGWA